MDFPGRLVAGCIAILLIVIFPLQYIIQSYAEDMDIYINNITEEFTNEIRQKGYIDIDMYERFMNQLDIFDGLYSVEMEDIRPVIGSELSKDGRREGILPATGFLTKGMKHNKSPAEDESHIASIAVFPDMVEVEQGQVLPIIVEAVGYDGSRSRVADWSSNYDPSRLGIQSVVIEYAGLGTNLIVLVKEATQSCLICMTSYPGSLDRCPVCSDTVIGINVIPAEIQIRQYEEIPITVIAYYEDGYGIEIEDWSIDIDTSRVGIFTAIVTVGDKSENILVTVLSPDEIECLTCGIWYDPGDSPKGCPECSKTIVAIEAYFMSGSNRVQQGSYPELEIVLIFRDGHRELGREMYRIVDYDPYQLGSQMVRVSYQGFLVQLSVEVVDTLSLVICPSGHTYIPDLNNPDMACPYCEISDIEDEISYYEINDIDTIEEQIYEKGIYYFQQGNYITVQIVRRDSVLTGLQKLFSKAVLLGRNRRSVHGGGF